MQTLGIIVSSFVVGLVGILWVCRKRPEELPPPTKEAARNYTPPAVP